jgi:hypothetical protein
VLGEELRPGLRAWTAYHEEWEQVVRGFAIDAPERLVLVDPWLAGDQWEGLEALRRERPLDVLVTVHWHVRSAAELRERHPGAMTLWCCEADRAPVAERLPVDRTFRVGEELPGGLVALAAPPRPEVVFWDAAHATLIAGDALLGDGELGEGLHLCPEDWTHEEGGLRTLREALAAEVLELPVEIVGTTHGELVTEDAPGALRRALA